MRRLQPPFETSVWNSSSPAATPHSSLEAQVALTLRTLGGLSPKRSRSPSSSRSRR